MLKIDEICAEIPKGSSGQQGLKPVSGGPVRFRHQVRDLAAAFHVYIDFVVLLAIGMDANRNYDHYVDGNSTKIDEALGQHGMAGALEGRRRQKERFQAVSGDRILHEHGIARVPPDSRWTA